MPETEETTVIVPVVVPDLAPEEPDNLALHVGRLHESHESMRREWAAHQVEMGQLKSLHQELLNELQTVEEIAAEVLEEEAVEETAVVADPVSQPESKKPHWLLRGLRGH